MGRLVLLTVEIATQYELSPPPGDAVSALAFAPNDSSKLLVSSWDKNVYSYRVADGAGDTSLTSTYEHKAPVLDVCFGANDNEAFTAGMDWAVTRFVDPLTGAIAMWLTQFAQNKPRDWREDGPQQARCPSAVCRVQQRSQ